jgi:hypothetical protein
MSREKIRHLLEPTLRMLRVDLSVSDILMHLIWTRGLHSLNLHILSTTHMDIVTIYLQFILPFTINEFKHISSLNICYLKQSTSNRRNTWEMSHVLYVVTWNLSHNILVIKLVHEYSYISSPVYAFTANKKAFSLSFLQFNFGHDFRKKCDPTFCCFKSNFVLESADPFEMPLTKVMLLFGFQVYFEYAKTAR